MLCAFDPLGSEGSMRGQGLVEYSLILVLVAIVVIAALFLLGPIIGNTFSTINNSLSTI
jgi:pilus assembly protein Flp/PilA